MKEKIEHKLTNNKKKIIDKYSLHTHKKVV